MKFTKRKRSKPHSLDKSIEKLELTKLAASAKYIGSTAHKNGKNPLVLDQWKISPRPNASICPAHIRDKKIVTDWLQEAIKKGAVSAGAGRVWYIGDDGIFEAITSGNKEYHGYPIELEELPKGVSELYGRN